MMVDYTETERRARGVGDSKSDGRLNKIISSFVTNGSQNEGFVC